MSQPGVPARPLLDVRGLKTRIRTHGGVVKAVEDVSFRLMPGETLGIVGESGSGKSMTGLSIMRLVPDPPGRIAGGEVLLDGQDLLKLSEREMRRVRGARIAMIFQDPMTSLNPVLTVQRQLTEAMEAHLGLAPSAATARALDLLRMVGIPNPELRLVQYPHQFSGGMRQRVMIAMALACHPQLIIADEPTTALDVTIQAQILKLIRDIQARHDTGVILITHSMGVVAGMTDRVQVMYAGSIVETASTEEVFASPSHPYTVGLLRSIPRLDARTKAPLVPVRGTPPELIDLPDACPFMPRCDFAREQCAAKKPPLLQVSADHWSACWHWEEVARAGARPGALA